MSSHAHQDKASEDSFPASDPPANTGVTGPGRDDDAIPTGRPTSDRHAMETAHQAENEEKGIDAARDLNSDEAED
ncbi:MAG: hypothetical protein ACJ8AW_07425 [Rhodopila sp.]